MQAGTSPSSDSSFNEVRARIYDRPASPDRLPDYDGASDWETVRALFLSWVSDRITRSMKRTLADAGDFKEDQPKLFHPKGVCAEGRWEISGASPYTGLFAAGTSAPAIVRMSASGNNTRIDPRFPAIPLLHPPRSFGLAVKLFPSRDPAKRVRTRNLLLFDHTGVDGNPSPWYMRGVKQPGGGFADQYFVNWMHGSGPITSGFARLFERFAAEVRHRSAESLAQVDVDGGVVVNPKCPRFVRLIPAASYPADDRLTRWEDFRREILDLAGQGPLAFEIAVSEDNPVETRAPRNEMTIGRLTLGTPVVSEVGDRQLHFTHRV